MSTKKIVAENRKDEDEDVAAANDRFLEHIDTEVTNHFRDQQTHWLLRIGSSLHPWFTPTSDIDYIAVMDTIHVDWVNHLPKTTADLDPIRIGNTILDNFYWRVSLGERNGHEITIAIYTTKRFKDYIWKRSGNKMYLLRERKILIGQEENLEQLKELFPPNIQTAQSDLDTLRNPKYTHRFLWAWRSISLLKEKKFLINKQEIIKWVTTNYGPNTITDRATCTNELITAIRANGGTVR